ncbi:MAG: hypothetical protein LBC97_13415 [Bifidobacteriaceae bacterium]|jgi:hypothetical protein|nr:hypothetical protein [Bifidobacteriaceae bacterium]
MSAAPAATPIRRGVGRPAAARTAPAAPLRLVVAPKRRRGFQLYVGLCLTLLAGALGTVLWLNTALAQGSFEIREYQVKLNQLEIEREAINEALVARAEPRALAAKATELGMIEVPATGYLVLRDGVIIGSAPPAGSDQGENQSEGQDAGESGEEGSGAGGDPAGPGEEAGAE